MICGVGKTFPVTKPYIHLLLAMSRTLCSLEHASIGTTFTRLDSLNLLSLCGPHYGARISQSCNSSGTYQTIDSQGGLGRPFEPEIHSSMAQQQQMGMSTQRSASHAADFLPYCSPSHPILPTIHSFPSLDGIALTLLYQPHCDPMLSCLSLRLVSILL